MIISLNWSEQYIGVNDVLFSELLKGIVMSELKPCPFCGKQPELEVSEVDLNGSATKDVFQYCCDDCGVYAPEFDDIEDSAKQWNTRATQSEWVSVDTPPKVSGAYWTFNGGDEKPSAIQQRVHMYDADHKQFNSHTVTHWKPLPTPPKPSHSAS